MVPSRQAEGLGETTPSQSRNSFDPAGSRRPWPRRNVEAHAASANAFDGLADGLAADGQLAAAVVAQERAVRLARQSADPSLAEFVKRLERRRAALAVKKP